MTQVNKKVCILAGGGLSVPHDYDEMVSSGAAPRTDYIELARKLDAELPSHPLANFRYSPKIRQLEQKASLDVSMAGWFAFNAQKYDVILSLAETVGIPLAGALKLLRSAIPHVLIGHKLSWRVQRYTWRFTNLQYSFSEIACVSKAQADYARSASGMNNPSSYFIYDKVDEKFFAPQNGDDEGYILSVGQEQRDYATLVQALAGTGKKLVIVASSPWATKKLNLPETDSKVTILSRIPFVKLRDLYAKAKMVAVSVNDVDFAAGVNGLLEGMSMAKPVVCCHTSGLSGYIEDGVTGRLVPPASPDILRERILELWDDPAMCARLGSAGRDAVVKEMTLDHYVDRLANLTVNAA